MIMIVLLFWKERKINIKRKISNCYGSEKSWGRRGGWLRVLCFFVGFLSFLLLYFFELKICREGDS